MLGRAPVIWMSRRQWFVVVFDGTKQEVDDPEQIFLTYREILSSQAADAIPDDPDSQSLVPVHETSDSAALKARPLASAPAPNMAEREFAAVSRR